MSLLRTFNIIIYNNALITYAYSYHAFYHRAGANISHGKLLITLHLAYLLHAITVNYISNYIRWGGFYFNIGHKKVSTVPDCSSTDEIQQSYISVYNVS